MSDKIGNMILKFRKEKGLKQKELAEIAGINRMSIGNYERGTRTPSAEVLNKIADALEVSINDLLGNSEQPIEFDIAKILSAESWEEATSLFTTDQQSAFKTMYNRALHNIGVIDGLKFGDMHSSFIDELYLSVSFTEILKNFNDEIQSFIDSEKSGYTPDEFNSSIEVIAKYTYETYNLLRKNIKLLEEGNKFYIENLNRPYFEKEIFEKYLSK